MGTLITTHVSRPLTGEALSGWKPEGIVIATLFEHKGSVNALSVSKDNVFMVSGTFTSPWVACCLCVGFLDR